MKKYLFSIVFIFTVLSTGGCNVVPEKVQKEANRVIPQVQGIASAVAEQQLSGNEPADWIALIQAGNAASAPFTPYAVPVGAGLTALASILGFLAKKKNDEAKKFGAKYQSHKQGVELSMKELLLDNSQQATWIDKVIYENIGLARQRNGV